MIKAKMTQNISYPGQYLSLYFSRFGLVGCYPLASYIVDKDQKMVRITHTQK